VPFTDGRVKRECKWCGQAFRPRVPDQRYCRLWCRTEAKAAEGRAARRVWWQAGRPKMDQFEDAKARFEDG
jgi:hypothetical protein